MKKWFRHKEKPVQRLEECGEGAEYCGAECPEEYSEEEYTDTEYAEPEYMESEYMEAEYMEPEESGEDEEFGEYVGYEEAGEDEGSGEPEGYEEASEDEECGEYVGYEEAAEGEGSGEPEEYEEASEGEEYGEYVGYEESGEGQDFGCAREGEEYFSAECPEGYSEEEYTDTEYAEPEYMDCEYPEAYLEEEYPEEYIEEYEESCIDTAYIEESCIDTACIETVCIETACIETEYMESEESGEFIEPEEVRDEEYAETGAYFEEAYQEPYGEGAGEPCEESSLWGGESNREPAGSRKTGSGGWLRRSLGKMDAIDRVMLVTGVAVLILAIAAGGIFISSRIRENQVADFAGLGAQLEGISIIGEKGLAAVADAETARIQAAVLAEEENEEKKDYNETAYDRQVSVSPVFTSIQKDLKIKFINQRTGKLVPNVPFSVTVTDPAGKSLTWFDDDMDGIIYKKDIAGGQYQVKMEELQDSGYSDYAVPGVILTAAVEEEIVYKQVDVANEVKKEDEVNAAQEDTKQNETVVESVLKDTVAWVESRVITDTYNEISRSEIPDPLTLAMNRALVVTGEESGLPDGMPRTAAESVSGGDAAAPEDEEGTEGASLTVELSSSSATVYLNGSAVINAVIHNTSGEAQQVTAESSNAGVAQVSVSGLAVTVTGVGEGSADITVRYTEGGREAAAVCRVTVRAHPSEDTRTKLKDAAGRQLYVSENDGYREAVYADYYKAEKFFLKGDVRYSGWQTIEGRIYYFTADGAKVTGEQVIQGARYTFAGDGSLVTGEGAIGIDVSKWNQTIDWTAVKNSGISYVIIRCGYRGSSAGKLIEDPKFEANIKGALAAGMKVGIYFYSQAVNEIEAVEEASMVLEQIRNYHISYPVFIDIEKSGGRGDKIDVETRTAVCKAFCQTIQNAGYTAGIYSNKLWMEQKVNMAQLNDYKVWLAQYAASPTYSGKYDIWQYKSNGSVSGISGNVDLNISYLEK